MEAPPPNLGPIAEDWVEQLCAATFLADFTIRSPKYRKADGQTKEAADILVFFRGTLLVLQVKTKMVSDAEVALTENDLKRATNAVGKAVDQLRAMLEAARDPTFHTFVNARGCELKVAKTEIQKIVAIVVYGLVAPDGQLSTTALRFNQSCFPDDGIPIHLFSMSEFRFLTSVLDTFPDFLLFLDVRNLLHQQNLISAQTLPGYVWALATFEPARLLELMKSKAPSNIAGLRDRHVESMARLEEAEKPSYFVDWLIEQLYAGLGRNGEVNEELVAKTKQLLPAGSIEAFQRIIPELAKLRRRDRVHLAAGFAEKIERAQKNGMAFRGMKFDAHDEGYFLLAIEGSRKERQAALFNLARAFAHKLGLRQVVAIATGPFPLGTSDCDVMIIDAKDMRVDASLLEAVEYFFAEPNAVILPQMTP
jgi:hypothetical protein